MTRLHDLYAIAGQSPWLDNLRRDWLEDGQLAELLDLGVRGITSNPTIFAKAMSGQDTYDEQFRCLMKDHTVEAAYWEMATTDIKRRARPAPAPLRRERPRGRLRVPRGVALAGPRHRGHRARRPEAPRADRAAQPVREGAGHPRGRAGHRDADRRGAQHQRDAHLRPRPLRRGDRGLPAAASRRWSPRAGEATCPAVASVASFFVSRVDTEVDRRLEALAGGASGDPAVLDLRGTAAVAQAQMAYQHFHRTFAGPRWEALRAKGARVQRPLWASTSTKNPAYPDLLYVDNLIGPATVNTMPDGTIADFVDHGTVARTVDADLDGREAVIDRLARGRRSTWRTWRRRSRTRACTRSPSPSTT